jgi:flagellar hook assembly protein FlgD
MITSPITSSNSPQGTQSKGKSFDLKPDDFIKMMVTQLQNQIGSAGNLIGKNVAGVDDQNNVIKGVVNSVKVQSDGVQLELDNGQSLPLAKVTDIAAASATSRGVTASPATTGA